MIRFLIVLIVGIIIGYLLQPSLEPIVKIVKPIAITQIQKLRYK